MFLKELGAVKKGGSWVLPLPHHQEASQSPAVSQGLWEGSKTSRLSTDTPALLNPA